MNNNKRITMVIPVYNSEKYLARCIDSVINQTINNYKILLINDGSIDNSQKIIVEYKNKYPEIIDYICQENMGVAKTRNKAINSVNTEYIMFMDNDDYIDKDYIKVLYENTDNEKMDIVLSGYRRTNQDGNVLEETKLYNCEWSKMMVQTPWAKIFRTSYLRENNIEFLDNNIGEDIYLNLLAVFMTRKINIIDYVGYNWFFNTESVSNTLQKDFSKVNVYRLLNSCYDELKKRNILEEEYEIIEAHFIRYIYWFIATSTINTNYRDMCKEYNNLFKWLKDRFPRYKKNKIIGLSIKKPIGDVYGNRRLYFYIGLTNRLKIGKPSLLIYNKLKKIKNKI